MDFLKRLGYRIRILRENLNMTQDELAIKSGYTSRSSINKIENGLVDIPQSKIYSIANALNISPSYLMGFEEEKETPDEPQLTEGERFMLEIFRQIPEEQQQVFLEMGRVYANSLKKD